jgi:hypothetical protein
VKHLAAAKKRMWYAKTIYERVNALIEGFAIPFDLKQIKLIVVSGFLILFFFRDLSVDNFSPLFFLRDLTLFSSIFFSKPLFQFLSFFSLNKLTDNFSMVQHVFGNDNSIGRLDKGECICDSGAAIAFCPLV